MPHRILSLEEVADMIHLPVQDVRRMTKYGEIPHEKQGNNLIFRKVEIDAWSSQNLLNAKENELERFHKSSSLARVQPHDLSPTHAILPELLSPDCIEPDFPARTKASVLRDMVALAENSGLIYDPKDLLESLVKREDLRPTAMDFGVALLHPRHHEPYMFEDSFIAFARAVQPVPFGAPDGERTNLFFLICCQADDIHLHLLARISMMCLHTSLIEDLRVANDTKDLHNAILDAEEALIQAKLMKAKSKQ